MLRACRQASELVSFLIIPAVVIFIVGASMARGDTGIDEFIYVGAVERLEDFLTRFPGTYFPYRFGYILPEQSAEALFGPGPGFVILRIVLLGLAGWALRNGDLRNGDRRIAAWTATIFLASSPIVLRAILDTYIDSLGVAFLVLGAALLVRSPESELGQRMAPLLAGVALALAWNSNLVLLLPASAIISFAALDEWLTHRSFRRGLDQGVYAVAGMLVTVAAGVLWYGINFGVWDLYSVAARQAGGETNATFRDTNPTWFSYRQYLLVIPVSLTFAWATMRHTADAVARRELRRLLGFTLLTAAAFSWIQFVGQRPVLQLFYYSCYPLSLAVLLLGRSVGEQLERIVAAPQRRWLALAGVTALWLGSHLALAPFKPRYVVVGSIALLVVGLVAVVGFITDERPRADAFRIASLVVAVLAAGWFTVSSPHDFPETSPGFRPDPEYDQILFRHDRSMLSVLAAVREFESSMPVLPEERGQIRVWFDGQGHTNQILSSLVHVNSALQLPESGNFLPEFGDFEQRRIEFDRPRFLVLLTATTESMDAGQREISNAALPYRLVWTEDQSHGHVTSFVSFYERNDGNWSDYPCPAQPGGGFALPCG